MAVFAYSARDKTREDTQERGYVVAATESEARAKLDRLQLHGKVHLKRLHGWKAFIKRFSADVR